jgi:hypothetical protein
MVLFDSVVHTTVESYETFRTSFVSGYVDSSRQPLADDALDRLIDLRVEALRRWIADSTLRPSVSAPPRTIGWKPLDPSRRRTAQCPANSHGERPPPPTSTRRLGAARGAPWQPPICAPAVRAGPAPDRSLFVSRGVSRARRGSPSAAGVGSFVGSGSGLSEEPASGCKAGHAGLRVVPVALPGSSEVNGERWRPGAGRRSWRSGA